MDASKLLVVPGTTGLDTATLSGFVPLGFGVTGLVNMLSMHFEGV